MAYRLPILYQRLLIFQNYKTLRKERSDINVLMMTGKNHIDLLKISVLSIARNWDKLPKLTIVSDGSLSLQQIEKVISFWKGELAVQNWADSIAYHKTKNRTSIAAYASANPFGKKMAVILHHAELYPTIWIDSDVLFFKDLSPFIPEYTDGIQCGGSEDNIAAYHDELVHKLHTNTAMLGKFNAGLLYVSGKNIYEKYKLDQLLSEIHPHYNFLTEQTIFAHIASQSQGIIWKEDIIRNFTSDNQDLKPTKIGNSIGRHYPSNVRHLIWRDAFFIKSEDERP